MKKLFLVGITSCLFLFYGCSPKGGSNKDSQTVYEMSAVSPVPPMGWNSFDAYDCRINEADFKANVDYMAENLLEYGWNYAVIDYIWWHPNPGEWDNPRRRFGHPDIPYAEDGKPLQPTTIDEFGRLLPAVERFPSAADGKGFKPIADYVHSKGMKFGIHIMRGIHRYAYYYDLPIKGTEFSAKDISDTSKTCNWCNHMFGVDQAKQGAQEYYNSLFELYASWEVDFVKIDDTMSPIYHKGEIEMVKNAVAKCGRPMVISLSCGEAPLDMAAHLAENSNMWRVSGDFWDEWRPLVHNFDLLDKWSSSIKPGSWPDADMIPIGRVSLNGRPHGPDRYSKFTLPEQYTMLSLWMIARSPLILGADLLTLPDSTLALLTNPEVIAVNQNSSGNKQVFRNDGKVAWIADDPASGGKYLALFNLNDSESTVDFSLQSEGMKGIYKVRDLWKRKDLGTFENNISVKIESHGSVLYKLEGI